MPVPQDKHFFIDPNRCIGCQACVQACTECDTHRGHSMIHLEYINRGRSTQTVPVICMHCDSPTCAEVCPADAIKRTEDGVVQSARKPRCILGISLASFSVGVGFVSGWYPPQRQGVALGVYGAGNIGQSLAAFGAPVVVGLFGYAWGFWTFALLTAIWLGIYLLLARDAPAERKPRRLSEVLQPLRVPTSWLLSLYYFLTFGGFVAMAIYLPIFLTEIFELSPRDAGFRTAGFIILATGMRPVGGMLADRVGGQRILRWVFPVTGAMAIFLACPLMSTFTIGALGMAAAIGLGNGAVFKLVPQYFPHAVGSVTGLVGAAGGLGGFLPPLVLGGIREVTGTFTWGFVLLAIFCLGCFIVSLTIPGRQPPVAGAG